MATPYRMPVWKKLQREIADLRIIVLSRREKNRDWKLGVNDQNWDMRRLRGVHIFFSEMDWGLHVNIFTFLNLLSAHPEAVIVTGYDCPSYWIALLYCRLFKKKFVFWNGSTLLSSRNRRGVIHRIKRYFIRMCDSYVTYGKKATEFLDVLGADSEKIITGGNAADTDMLSRSMGGPAPDEEIRRKLKLTSFVFVYVGQVIERKGLVTLLDAFRIAQDSYPDIGLLLIGNGNLHVKIEKKIAEDEIRNVFLQGFVQQEDLGPYLSVCDAFILPSLNEAWGLAVNEAMACGLPVLVSRNAGSAHELIREGENGYTFDPQSVRDVSGRMMELIEMSKSDRLAMGRLSSAIIAPYTPAGYARQIMAAAERAFCSPA